MKRAAMLLLALAACGGGRQPDAPGDAGPDAGDAGDAGSDAGCDLLALDVSGSLDIDLHAVSVSGTVTLDGSPAPASDPRGEIIFSSDGGMVHAALPDAGAATYSARLFAGTYDVSFSKSAACDPGKLPCGTPLLEPQAPLFVSGSLDLDVKSPPALITVSGAVTANGGALASGARGRIEFVQGAAAVGADLPTSGAATFSVQLAPGQYDVRITQQPSCTQASPLPCQTYVWKRAQPLTVSGSLAIDLPVVHLSGAVTVNGGTLANASGSRGSIALLDADGNGPAVSLGATGAGSYAANVYAGTHDIYVQPLSPCTPGPLPCAAHFAAQVAVPVSGAYDLDLPVVQVTGHVTENGAAPPAAVHGVSRGALVFTPVGPALAGSEVRAELGQNGAATYSVLLYAGTHAIAIDNPADCPDGAFPCGRYAKDQRQIEVSGAFDFDLSVARVSLTVTANGEGVASSPTGSARGAVTLHGETDVAVALPPSGAATAAATVYAGSNTLSFANDKDCPRGPLPCQTFADSVPRSIAVSGPLAWDLPVIDVSGTVTANGLAPGASTGPSRGSIRFSAPRQPPVDAPLGASGDALYSVRLFPGTYTLDFVNTTDCPPNAEGALPCQATHGLIPSFALATSGTFDVDLPIRELSGQVTLDGARLADSPRGASRGTLRFGDRAVDLGATGAAQYRVKLIQGRYPVRIDNPADCPGALPCGGTLLSQCH